MLNFILKLIELVLKIYLLIYTVIHLAFFFIPSTIVTKLVFQNFSKKFKFSVRKFSQL